MTKKKKDINVQTFDVRTEGDARALAFGLCTFKEKTVPYFEEGKSTLIDNDTWVRYGRDGKYPKFLYEECYLKSTILQTLINGTSSYIMGDGIEFADLNNIYGATSDGVVRTNNIYWEKYVNEDGDQLIDIVKKCIVDYLIFGGVSIMVKRNSFGEVCELRWLDFQNCRSNKRHSKIFYWENGFDNATGYKQYPSFHADSRAITSIYYFTGHISRGTYPVSIWNSAIASVLTSVEIGKFHLSTIRKNFSGSMIINYNSTDYTEEQKKMIRDKVKEQFGGADNAGSVMLAFNNGKENAVTVARIPEDSFDKKYDTLKESTMSEIFIAFGATPSLFGFTSTNDVFSKEKFLESFEIYNKTRVQGYQNDIERIFSRIFGVDKAFEFKPFKLSTDGDRIIDTSNEETIE